MFDVFETINRFIDCEEVREYNRFTNFAPIEQALLIYYSRSTTMYEKLAAWKELLDAYPEEAFDVEGREVSWTQRWDPNNGRGYWGHCGEGEKPWSNKEILCYAVDAYERALQEHKYAPSVIYETSIYCDWESDLPSHIEFVREPERAYFSDYDSAWEHLYEIQRQCSEGDCSFKGAEIIVKHLNVGEDDEGSIFCFDRDLRLITVKHHEGDDCMNLFFVYIPLPFKKGDILRVSYYGETLYGVLWHDVSREDFSRAIRGGDGVDMSLGLMTFQKENGKWVFDDDACHPNFLWAEKCPDDELPEDQSILLLLRAVYKGEMSWEVFLHLYSLFGEKAYQIMRNITCPARLENEDMAGMPIDWDNEDRGL